MDGLTWFDQCTIYLNKLEDLDEDFTLYDTLPTATKEEKEVKRMIFERMMRFMRQKKQIEADLEEEWGYRLNQELSRTPNQNVALT